LRHQLPRCHSVSNLRPRLTTWHECDTHTWRY
jgi:hypothetical protein